MQIGVLGISHKLADLKLREKLAQICQNWFITLQKFSEAHPFVLLSTCNRTEIYFSSDDLILTQTYLSNIFQAEVNDNLEHKLYAYFGVSCFSHLTRVTLGLDSAIIGETEIQGQVKLAYENASVYHSLPSDLHFLFQKALGIAKQLRAKLQLGRGLPNLEHAILQTGKNVFQNPEETRLLFVGASEINRKILSFLKHKHFQDMTLCNRSEEQADRWAEFYKLNRLGWSELNRWPDYDWIIFGTKSPHHLAFQKEIHNHKVKPKLIIDLSVPRNVEPCLIKDDRIILLNIDQINQRLTIRHRQMAHILSEAEESIAKITQEQAARYAAKNRSIVLQPVENLLKRQSLAIRFA